MNLWLILIGRPDSASGRNAPGKAQRPAAVIGGGVLSNRFSGVPPEVGFGLGQARRFCGACIWSALPLITDRRADTWGCSSVPNCRHLANLA